MENTEYNSIRFWKKVNKMDADKCWEWTGARNAHGYGTFTWNIKTGVSKSVLAHRISYSISVGEVPDEMCVLHKCDNPPCVNPNHLFLGTRDDNAKDMKEKGRAKPVCGERNNFSKLNWRKVCEIRISSFTQSEEVADWYNITPALVVAIRSWKTWRRIGGVIVGRRMKFGKRTQVRDFITKSVTGKYRGYHRKYIYARVSDEIKTR